MSRWKKWWISLFYALSHQFRLQWEHSTVYCRQISFTYWPIPGSPTCTASEAPQCSGKHSGKRERAQQCHLGEMSIFPVAQTVQGYPFRTARQLLCRLTKISSEKQTTFSYHFIQYMHIKKISILYKELKQYNLNMPSNYKPYIHRNICLYKLNKTTLLQDNSVEVFGGNHDR